MANPDLGITASFPWKDRHAYAACPTCGREVNDHMGEAAKRNGCQPASGCRMTWQGLIAWYRHVFRLERIGVPWTGALGG